VDTDKLDGAYTGQSVAVPLCLTLDLKMAKADIEYKVQEPGLFVFIIAVILGSGVSFVLATYLLGLSSLWVSLLLGAIFGLIGLFLGENIAEAIIFCFGFGFLVFFLLKIASEIELVRASIVPIATGFCLGKIICGIWKEIK
jgi:hypothetical protein